MTSAVIPESRCPACGAEHDRHSCFAGNAVPAAGDFSVCCYCGTVLIFGADLVLRIPAACDLEHFRTEAPADYMQCLQCSLVIRMQSSLAMIQQIGGAA